MRGHAATNRVSSFTFCLHAKFRQDVPRVATFNTRILHVPIKIHVVHDATMLSNPSFPPAFFFNFPSKSKRNYKIYAHRSVVAARLDDWSTPRYYPAVLTPVSSEVEPFRATTIQGAPIATYLHVLAYNSCTRVCVSYATRTCR